VIIAPRLTGGCCRTHSLSATWSEHGGAFPEPWNNDPADSERSQPRIGTVAAGADRPVQFAGTFCEPRRSFAAKDADRTRG
jgi:hypothetical protein